MKTHILNDQDKGGSKYQICLHHNENSITYDIPSSKFSDKQIREFFPKFAKAIDRGLNTDGTFSATFIEL